MCKELKISVIIPAYNAESSLRRCLDSIIRNDSDSFEVILVDDGSTDSTPVICDEYAQKDSRIRVFHKCNGGVSSARNLGLDNARGQWVTFVDSDDAVMEEWISSILSTIQSHPNCDLVVENYVACHYGGGRTEVKYDCCTDGWLSLKRTGLWQNVWNKVFLSSILKDNGIRFNETLSFFEDAVFVTEYLSFTNCIVPTCVVSYMQYLPSSYKEKYRDYTTPDMYLQYYQLVREANEPFSKELVDDVVMRYIHSKYDVANLKEAVGSSIKYAKGRRKFAIRWLSYFDIKIVWKLCFSMYRLL